jgi:hypothetical protein
MSRWFWILLSAALSSSIYLSIRYGLKPKPIPQINPTAFDKPEQIGATVYRRLRGQIRREGVLVLGSTPLVQSYDRIWDGFLRAAYEDRVHVEVAYQLRDLLTPPALSNLRPSELGTDEKSRTPFVQEVLGHYRRGKMVVIHTLSEDASHLVKGSISRRLSRLPNNPVVSISIVPFAVTKEGVESLQPPCQDSLSQEANNQRLACAAKRISEKFLRKHLPTDKYVAAVERHGLKEYLLFVYEPR